MRKSKKPDERYDPQKHGELSRYVSYSEHGEKPKRGVYTVISNRRNHYWVGYDYLFTGSYWVTPGGVPTKTVAYYDPASRFD